MAIKKTLLFLLLTTVIIEGNAQLIRGDIGVNAGVGFSLFGVVSKLAFRVDDMEFNAKATPAYVGAIDWGIQDHLSIGVGGGYQKTSFTVIDHGYIDENGNVSDATFHFSASRLNVGVRILGHWGGEGTDVYFGIKPGVNIGQVTYDQQIRDFPSGILNYSGSRFALQIIPIGLKAYISDNIGIFVETGIGAPSLISGGICIGLHAPVREINSK